MLITLDTKCMILKNYKHNSVYIYKKAVDNYHFIHNSMLVPHNNLQKKIASQIKEVILVRLKGFEPPAHALEGRCSIQLS